MRLFFFEWTLPQDYECYEYYDEDEDYEYYADYEYYDEDKDYEYYEDYEYYDEDDYYEQLDWLWTIDQ